MIQLRGNQLTAYHLRTSPVSRFSSTKSKMDSDGACSDSGQSDNCNEVEVVSPRQVPVAATLEAYYAKGDKIMDFLASKKIQAWTELAEIRAKVRPGVQLTTVPRFCALRSI